MRWISILDPSVQPNIGIEYLVWVNEVTFDEEGEEITGGYPQVAKFILPTNRWVETMDGLTLRNVTHFAEIERPE